MNYYGYEFYRETDIAHHGILGMKWGVRRFQNKDGTLTAAGKKRYGADTDNNGQVDKLRKGNRTELAELAAATAFSAAMLNPLTFTYNLSMLTVRSIQTGEAYIKEKAAEKRMAAAETDKKTGFKLKSNIVTGEEDAKMVNPGYKNFNTNTKNNCVLCTVAYDLRRRGFDVVAGKAGFGFNSDEYSKWYKGAKAVPIKVDGLASNPIAAYHQFGDFNLKKHRELRAKMASETTSQLLKQGVGARGLLRVQWESLGGHAIAYEVTSSGVQVFDAQSGKKTSIEKLSKSAIGMGYMRLDNCKPNYDLMKKEGVIKW